MLMLIRSLKNADYFNLKAKEQGQKLLILSFSCLETYLKLLNINFKAFNFLTNIDCV